jgi:hypothetical protein
MIFWENNIVDYYRILRVHLLLFRSRRSRLCWCAYCVYIILFGFFSRNGVNFREIPHGKPACWRSLLREAGGEKVNTEFFLWITTLMRCSVPSQYCQPNGDLLTKTILLNHTLACPPTGPWLILTQNSPLHFSRPVIFILNKINWISLATCYRGPSMITGNYQVCETGPSLGRLLH